MGKITAKSVAFFLAVSCAVTSFTTLGLWQLERRAWKHGLIAQIEQRVHAHVINAPAPELWPFVTANHDAYRHVTVQGVFMNNLETLVHANTAQGPGYWVMTPLATDAGFSVLINRGFIPSDRRDHASRAAGDITEKTTVAGLLRITEPKGGFLRANVPVAEIWYSRDVAAIATARELKNAAPYFIDADATPNAGGIPIGGLTEINFPDNHLLYAIIWFSLAFMLGIAAYKTARKEN